jgi:hypothetical protein
MCYPQVTSLWSDYPRLLLRVASSMPLLDFSFFAVIFLRLLLTCDPYGVEEGEDVLSAGNLLVVGLPAVTTSCGISDAIIGL